MKRTTMAAVAAVLLAAVAGGCTPGGGGGGGAGGQGVVRMARFEDVPDSAWAALAATRIYFGHQSVGGNVMDGVRAIADARPELGLRVLEAAPADSGGAIVHGLVGRNGDPALKTDDFARNVAAGAAGPVRVALHKYCYADIIDTTDVEPVLRHYRETMARLEAEHPDVAFVHVTAPLVRVQSGPRATLKKLLGQAPGRYASNFKREEFNEALRREYGASGRLFDLAAVESTRPDGSRETITLGGRTAYALFPGYTDDGSHLNAEGRRRAAEALLALLAGLPARR